MQKPELSNELWERITPHLPKHRLSPLGGRPRPKPKQVFEGIAFVKANKLPWRGIPKEVYGCKTALNDYYRYWAKQGVFHALKEDGILHHPELININFDWEKIESLFGQGSKR